MVPPAPHTPSRQTRSTWTSGEFGCKSATRHKELPFYLNKYSNTTGFAVADMDERFGKYDSELAQIQEFMKSTAMDKDRHQEELDAARKRGEYLLFDRSSLVVGSL